MEKTYKNLAEFFAHEISEEELKAQMLESLLAINRHFNDFVSDEEFADAVRVFLWFDSILTNVARN